MPPAARLGDMHTCPLLTPTPHIGGPIVIGAPNVMVGMMPAARVGDPVTCLGPPDLIVRGSATVLIGGMPAARLGDQTAHGGVIVMGIPTVIIGETGAGGAGPIRAAFQAAAAGGNPLVCKGPCEACDDV